MDPDLIGGSDHHLVWSEVPVKIISHLHLGFGRAGWTDSEQWKVGLEAIAPLISLLAESVECLLDHPGLRPAWFGGVETKKQRRALLDGAAWARDMLYVVIGHAAEAVFAKVPPKDSQRCASVSTSPKQDHAHYKYAVAAASWRSRKRVVDEYFRLRSISVGAGEKFLSQIFKLDSSFSISLVDPDTGRTQAPHEMLQTLTEEYLARAQNSFAQDKSAREEIEAQITTIRSAGAAPGALRGPLPCGPPTNQDKYTAVEFGDALSLLKTGEAVTHGSYAALRAEEATGRRLSLALIYLGRHLCLTSVHWPLRLIRGLRKSGPRIVRKVKCLRGISIATDMASLQDALWIGRNAERLQVYAGVDQHGGVGDPLFVVLAVVLLAQLREFQGFDTWLGFADLQ